MEEQILEYSIQAASGEIKPKPCYSTSMISLPVSEVSL